ncbi:putative 5xTM membrane YitT family protein [Sphaerotilus hippei]|uniref:Putative 5xTM membrane YitT family protein n=1 Tax=Sphaerotilus hippei TaxID=744406 RepID=A0A318GVA6_9BURK|nr:YitT family protein [Sphaerotilus hippei]PXW92341.1 putative 5xTM membrane YitT family protein [Sphaerotilus hippei]
MSATSTLPPAPRHTLFEDAQALFAGTLFVSLALILFKQVGMMTGGTAGAAFLVHYASGLDYGQVLFAINLPFYWFAWKRMGGEFTLKTFGAITMLSFMTSWSPTLFAIERLHPAYAAILGGLLLGTGCLFLARHRASLGGATIISLYLQQVHGLRAGKVQMGLDSIILLAAFLVIPAERVMYSLLAAAVMSLFLAINHKPGRYTVH